MPLIYYEVVGCSIILMALGKKDDLNTCVRAYGRMYCVVYSEWLVRCRWWLECWLVGV